MGSLMVSVIMKILLSPVLLYSCVQAQRSPLAKKFKDEGVVKDVLSEAPKNQLSVDYVEEEVSVDLGNTLTVSKAQSKPKVVYEQAKDDKVYTLAMVDPDAPSRDDPKAAQWLPGWLSTFPEMNSRMERALTLERLSCNTMDLLLLKDQAHTDTSSLCMSSQGTSTQEFPGTEQASRLKLSPKGTGSVLQWPETFFTQKINETENGKCFLIFLY